MAQNQKRQETSSAYLANRTSKRIPKQIILKIYFVKIYVSLLVKQKPMENEQNLKLESTNTSKNNKKMKEIPVR